MLRTDQALVQDDTSWSPNSFPSILYLDAECAA